MSEQNNHQIAEKERLDKALAKESRSFLGFFIKNYRFTYLIIFAILLVGFFAMFTLPREADPEVKVPIAVVTTVYLGASPTDVEDLVTNEIEEKVKNLDDLKEYTSTSGAGISSVVVEFDANADLKDSYQKLRDAVDEASPNLPETAEEPVVTEIRVSDIPIVTYSLVGELTDVELKQYADLLQDNFEGIQNVSDVVILGGIEREFQVIVDQKRLAGFGLTLSQVSGAIQQANINVPAGDIEIDGFNYSVRVEGKFETAREIADIVVANRGDATIYVRDVAQVVDGFAEQTTESRIGFNGDLPNNTISLQIYKKAGGNILDIVAESNTVIESLQASGELPENVRVQKTNDNSVFIRDDLSRLSQSGFQTMFLIVLILFSVLGFRAALITGLSVPIAFLMAFIALYFQGQTINSMVLFSLVLSLGLMVDNSIVIMEGINEYMKKHGKSALDAALLSVSNYKWPIISGTMTTVSAFAPMLLVSGILGEYLAILPMTISATLISSLFVALVILPTLSARKIKEHSRLKYEKEHNKKHWFTHYMGMAKSRYEKLLRDVLPSKKKRRRALAIAWALFFVSIFIPASGLVRVELFPQVDIDYFVVNVELPVGSVLEDTKKVVAEAESIIATIPEIDNYVTNIGTSASIGLTGGGSGSTNSHLASITANLKSDDERERKSFDIARSIREDIEAIQGGSVTLEELNAGPPTGAPIEVRLFGEDIGELSSVTQDVKNALKDIEGVINIKDNFEDATGELTFSINTERVDYYGLSIAGVAGTLRQAVFGALASEVNVAGEDVDVRVKYADSDFETVTDLENITIATPTGELIPIKQVATLAFEPSLLNIRHTDGETTVSVTADLEEGASLQTALVQFEEQRKILDTSDTIRIEVGGEVEDIDQSFRETFLSMIVAVILIAFILVLQFNSFRQPFIILYALPLAVIGVVFGLLVMRLPFSFPVFIGIVSLSGIVVNDAIVLIDKVNKNLKDGMKFVDGIVDAGMARMQPIFLTSLTTIAGILPLTFADELWRGLGWAVIFGLIFSTVLTLVMVPIIYAGLCKDDRCFE
ncbi:MAG: efflux RND transporter permease subunit [Patescibacteria group bacterium]